MGNALFLYEPKSDNALLGGGDWRAGLPLANLIDPRLSKVARSSNTLLASTQFRVSLPTVTPFRALAMGPMNITTAYRYRIRTWSAGFVGMLSDTGWVKPFDGQSAGPLELEWEDPNFWLGLTPFEDQERGVWLIHDFGTPQVGQFWTFEIDDQTNPDGYIEIGRLFMGSAFQPTLNYGYDNNGLSFENNALMAPTLSGGTQAWRRLNPRVFRAAFPNMAEAEAFDEVYRMFRSVGFDGEVLVIPDPDDAANIQKRSIFGNFRTMDALSQTAFGLVGTGFEIKEII